MGKAANERKRQHKAQQRKWRLESPIDTVDQAVDYLLARLDAHTLESLRATPEESAEHEFHRDLGMFIRNHFGLWQHNVNLLRSCGDENMFPDDASAVIIRALVKRLKTS